MLNKQKEHSKIKWDEERGALATDRKLIFKLFNPNFNKDEIILDIGCGDGIYLQDIKCKKVGLDISITNLKKARQRNPDGLFVLGDAENLPFKNEIFNSIFIVEVLHHLPDYKKCFKEVHRVLKLNGELNIEGQNSDSLFLVYPFYLAAEFVAHSKGNYDEGPGIPLRKGLDFLCDLGFNIEYIGSKGTSIKSFWFCIVTPRRMPFDREIRLSDKPAIYLDAILRRIIPPRLLIWYKLKASKKIIDLKKEKNVKLFEWTIKLNMIFK